MLTYLPPKVKEKIIRKLLFSLGVGSGGLIESSGEDMVIKLLKTLPYFGSKDNLCVFDVGANVGKYLTSCVSILNKIQLTPPQQNLKNLNSTITPISIHCFEPSQFTFQKLCATTKSLNAPHIRIVLNNCGLSDKQIRATLYYNEYASGLASLSKRRLEHHHINMDKSEEVEIMRLDTYCAQQDIRHIHLLKIDVEGHELDVLNGGKEFFEKKAIDMVTFEFGGCNIDTRTYFQDFWYFFKTYDYKIYRILPNGTFFYIDTYNEEREQFLTSNYLVLSSNVSL